MDMINWLKRLLKIHTHEWTKNPLIVSGYGYTEYEIYFCKSSKCLACNAVLTKQLW